MEATLRMSVAKWDSGMRTILSEMDASTRQIAKLKDYAMDRPESSEAIVAALKDYTERYRGTRKGAAACKAITAIMTVRMLEMLQE